MQLTALPSPHNNYVIGVDKGITPNNIRNPTTITKNQTTTYPFLVDENVRSNQSTRQNISAIA
jgi:hypothetical protein